MAAHRELWHKGLQRRALLTRKLGLGVPHRTGRSRSTGGATLFLASGKRGRPLSPCGKSFMMPPVPLRIETALRGGTTTPCSTHEEHQAEPRQNQTAEQAKLRLP